MLLFAWPLVVALASGIFFFAATVVDRMLIVGLGVAGVLALILLMAPSDIGKNIKLPISMLLALTLYIAMCVLNLFFLSQSFLDLFIRRVEFMAFAIGMIIIFRSSGPQPVLNALRIGVVLATIFVLMDYFIPRFTVFLDAAMHDSRKEYFHTHRASGFFANPNGAGGFLAITAPLCAVGLSIWKRGFFYTVALVGILATYSRGSLVVMAVAIGLVETFGATRDGRLKINVFPIVAGVVALIVGGAVFLSATGGFTGGKQSARGDSASRLTTIGDSSTQERVYLMNYASSEFQKKPIFGHGVGYDYNWALPRPVHNIYLLMLVEHGVVGIVWFAFLLFAMSRCGAPYGIIGALLYALWGVFNHSLFNDVPNALPLALYAIVGARDPRAVATVEAEPVAPADRIRPWRAAVRRFKLS